jgi:hypothetical protein
MYRGDYGDYETRIVLTITFEEQDMVIRTLRLTSVGPMVSSRSP